MFRAFMLGLVAFVLLVAPPLAIFAAVDGDGGLVATAAFAVIVSLGLAEVVFGEDVHRLAAGLKKYMRRRGLLSTYGDREFRGG